MTGRHVAEPQCTGGVFCSVPGHVEYAPNGNGGFQATHIP